MCQNFAGLFTRQYEHYVPLWKIRVRMCRQDYMHTLVLVRLPKICNFLAIQNFIKNHFIFFLAGFAMPTLIVRTGQTRRIVTVQNVALTNSNAARMGIVSRAIFNVLECQSVTTEVMKSIVVNWQIILLPKFYKFQNP